MLQPRPILPGLCDGVFVSSATHHRLVPRPIRSRFDKICCHLWFGLADGRFGASAPVAIGTDQARKGAASRSIGWSVPLAWATVMRSTRRYRHRRTCRGRLVMVTPRRRLGVTACPFSRRRRPALIGHPPLAGADAHLADLDSSSDSLPATAASTVANSMTTRRSGSQWPSRRTSRRLGEVATAMTLDARA